jgi:hypothetical protein
MWGPVPPPTAGELWEGSYMRRLALVLFELTMLAASVVTGGPLPGFRAVAVVLAAMLCVLLVFVVLVLVLGLVAQREPPYPI